MLLHYRMNTLFVALFVCGLMYSVDVTTASSCSSILMQNVQNNWSTCTVPMSCANEIDGLLRMVW